MLYCPLCKEYHSKFWDCAIRKVQSPNSSEGRSEVSRRQLVGFYAYETAEAMGLIDMWLMGKAIGEACWNRAEVFMYKETK